MISLEKIILHELQKGRKTIIMHKLIVNFDGMSKIDA
jgi:hypothetical protein